MLQERKIYWRAVAKAYHNATGMCLTKSEAIQIAKELNKQMPTSPSVSS